MLNFADAKEKSGVELGKRPVPSFKQPFEIKGLPEGMMRSHSIFLYYLAAKSVYI
jgi:hypothetical protein